MPIEIFGLKIGRSRPALPNSDERTAEFGGLKSKKTKTNNINPSFAVPMDNDGAFDVIAGGLYSMTMPIDGNIFNESQLILKYREMAMNHDCDRAISEIVNEAIVEEPYKKSVSLNFVDDTKVSKTVQKAVRDEFDNILKLLNFNEFGSDMFRRWYIDGRIYFHKIVDKENPNLGILELRPIDAIQMKKVRDVKKEKDPNNLNIEIVTDIQEFFVYTETIPTFKGQQWNGASATGQEIKISEEAIAYVYSGKVDPSNKIVLSYLHNSIRPLNQLRMMEDASLIARLVRAPSRRAFYVNVGNLPKQKAEQYVNSLMDKYRNKVVYNTASGEVSQDYNFMSILEDYWIPTRGVEGTTKIETIEGQTTFDNMEPVQYFEEKFYRSLNVPASRMDKDSQFFTPGNSNAVITREELKFWKLVQKLRKQFTRLFLNVLQTQCILKQICDESQWEELSENIQFDFSSDSYYAEIKNGEILKSRIELLGIIEPYVGKYYTKKFVQKQVLQLTDEEIEEIENELNFNPDLIDKDKDGGSGSDGGSLGYGGVIDSGGKDEPGRETESGAPSSNTGGFEASPTSTPPAATAEPAVTSEPVGAGGTIAPAI